MSLKYICGLLFTILAFASTSAQIKIFTIKVAGLKIGNLYANHIKNQNYDYYVTNSVVEIYFFKKIKVHVKTESLYKDGLLIKSTVKSNLGGKDYCSRTVWKNDHYDINCYTYKYAYRDSTLTTPIKWSASKLYFEKPVAGDEVYTESYGKLGTLTEVENKSLKMISPKSKQIYTYSKDGKLTGVEVINSVKNFEISAVEDNP